MVIFCLFDADQRVSPLLGEEDYFKDDLDDHLDEAEPVTKPKAKDLPPLVKKAVSKPAPRPSTSGTSKIKTQAELSKQVS